MGYFAGHPNGDLLYKRHLQGCKPNERQPTDPRQCHKRPFIGVVSLLRVDQDVTAVCPCTSLASSTPSDSKFWRTLSTKNVFKSCCVYGGFKHLRVLTYIAFGRANLSKVEHTCTCIHMYTHTHIWQTFVFNNTRIGLTRKGVSANVLIPLVYNPH